VGSVISVNSFTPSLLEACKLILILKTELRVLTNARGSSFARLIKHWNLRLQQQRYRSALMRQRRLRSCIPLNCLGESVLILDSMNYGENFVEFSWLLSRALVKTFSLLLPGSALGRLDRC